MEKVLGDISFGSKNLASTKPTAAAKSGGVSYDEHHKSLIDLYNKHDGDIEAIFRSLNENPEKALKPHHKPKTAREFAEKYSEGYYSVIAEAK